MRRAADCGSGLHVTSLLRSMKPSSHLSLGRPVCVKRLADQHRQLHGFRLDALAPGGCVGIDERLYLHGRMAAAHVVLCALSMQACTCAWLFLLLRTLQYHPSI